MLKLFIVNDKNVNYWNINVFVNFYIVFKDTGEPRLRKTSLFNISKIKYNKNQLLPYIIWI